MSRYDFVVIGGGAAGCMVAVETAQQTRGRVLLVEAGAVRPSVPRRPAEYLKSFRGALDWDLETTPQPGLARRVLRWPRGRGLGGSMLLNAMIWRPPIARDWQTLLDHAGPTWDLTSLRKDLAAVEQQLQPEAPRWLSESARRFLQAAAGSPAATEDAPCVYQRTNRWGRRRTVGDLLQETVDQQVASGGRASLEVHSATVDSILWDRERAVGVRLIGDGGGLETVEATRGVVLCAGTIHSPAILMRSGIGPALSLRENGIEIRHECADVGCHLADHLVMPVIWSTPEGSRFPASWSVRDLARWSHGGTGPIASNLAEVGGFFELPRLDGATDASMLQQPSPLIQLHVTPTDYLRYPQPTAPAAMTIGVTDSAPRSRGRVLLRSRDGTTAPIVEANYLQTPTDQSVLVQGIRFARKLAAASPLADWCGNERLPGEKRQSDADLARAVARYAQTLYHPVGTCRLGSDAASVVAPDFRVRGTESLWVCDASVLPAMPAANPTALILTLGRRLGRSLAA